MNDIQFILKDHLPVSEPDLIKWAMWMGNDDNTRVDKTSYPGEIDVSTVFLGLSVGEHPLLFETIVFGGHYNMYQNRCSTWEEAEAMHKEVCAKVEKEIPPENFRKLKI